MSNRQYTDEELTAFLDGEAEDELAFAIATQMETDDDLNAQIAALDFPKVALVEAYDALLADAPEMPYFPEMAEPAPQQAKSRFGWGWGLGTFGTGIAAGLAVALFTGLGTPPPAPAPGWVAFVASYQSLYTEATLRDVSPTETDAAVQLAAVSDELGLDLTSLPEADGLTFKRAQVLAFRGKPLIQIAFQREDGTPVALCILPAGPDGKPVSMGAAQGMALARWNTPGFGYLLIGGEDAAPLESEADTFRNWSVGA